MTGAFPATLARLVARYNPGVFELGRRSARLRLEGAGPGLVDVVIDERGARLVVADTRRRADATLTADPRTWSAIERDLGGGMAAYRAGRLSVRHDLHLGVGFLAATAAPSETGLRFRRITTSMGDLSISEAGIGPPVLLIHGLGATKVSFLPTVAAMAPHHRAIAVDLPGFGDSTKPIRAGYDAPYFAAAMVALLDALEIDSAFVVGNSMGGRIAIELGLEYPSRVLRLGLLAPSLAWRKPRPWAPYLRLLIPQLGLLQPAPRSIVEPIVRGLIPGGDEGWTAAGVDEFLRAYLSPRGRAAFYAAARNIYLEEPFGPRGFWNRLPGLDRPALFIWGRRDPLVPLGFAQHVRRALPSSQDLVLECGHVPQLERPQETHAALARFFATRERASQVSART